MATRDGIDSASSDDGVENGADGRLTKNAERATIRVIVRNVRRGTMRTTVQRVRGVLTVIVKVPVLCALLALAACGGGGGGGGGGSDDGGVDVTPDLAVTSDLAVQLDMTTPVRDMAPIQDLVDPRDFTIVRDMGPRLCNGSVCSGAGNVCAGTKNKTTGMVTGEGCMACQGSVPQYCCSMSFAEENVTCVVFGTTCTGMVCN
jgi:hypothetical protein